MKLSPIDTSNPWKNIVLGKLCSHGTYRYEHEDDPQKAIEDLLTVSNLMTLDPLIFKKTTALVAQGAASMKRKSRLLVWWFDLVARLDFRIYTIYSWYRCDTCGRHFGRHNKKIEHTF